MKLKKKQYQDLEKQFFDFDEENKIVHLRRDFEKPGAILDLNAFTKIPVMSVEFIEWLTSLFYYVPKKYKLDIVICFDDMEGFDEKELSEICRQNLLLEMKIQNRKATEQNMLALLLCLVGLIISFIYFWVDFLWVSEGALKEIIMFILEILATVPFWGAADIYFVGNSEQRETVRRFKKQFYAISFIKINDEQTC